MAHENFLWGAPRIHGELLMLGFTVSQATVSRYMPARSRRPTQSWRTFLRNQTIAFGQYSQERGGLLLARSNLRSRELHEIGQIGRDIRASIPGDLSRLRSRGSGFEKGQPSFLPR
jgi:hypothetical protein